MKRVWVGLWQSLWRGRGGLVLRYCCLLLRLIHSLSGSIFAMQDLSRLGEFRSTYERMFPGSGQPTAQQRRFFKTFERFATQRQRMHARQQQRGQQQQQQQTAAAAAAAATI